MSDAESLRQRWQELVLAIEREGTSLPATAGLSIQRLRELSTSRELDNSSWELLLRAITPQDLRDRVVRIDDHAHVRAGERRTPRVSAFRADLVAVGALNIDHIVHGEPSAPAQRQRLAALIESETSERSFATQAEVVELLARVRESFNAEQADAAILNALGGSAYNVIRTLGDSDLGLTLGFVGVQGAPLFQGMRSHASRIKAKVDTRFVFQDPKEPVGRCVSVMRGADDFRERTMGVWPGANARFAREVGREFWSVVDYCSGATMVHLTSFFDPGSAEVLADLADVLATDGQTLVSFDPGLLWCTLSDQAVDAASVGRILGATTTLFTSAEELFALASNYLGWTDRTLAGVPARPRLKSAATTLFDNFPSLREIVTRYGRTAIVLRATGGNLITTSPPLDGPIVDDTGAGDLFAAGFLAERLTRSGSNRESLLRGLQLVSAKLGTPGALSADTVARAFEARPGVS